METMLDVKWFLPAVKMPFSKQRVRFIDNNGSEHLGIFIQSEDMFFIGFDEFGDFRFTYEVYAWTSVD